MSVYDTLSKIDVGEHIEKVEYIAKKTGKKVSLSYLSWAWAWGVLKEHYPEAQTVVYDDPNGRIYWTDGKTAWVKTGVIVEGIEHIEFLPIMDRYNNSIPLERVQSTDVNKAIQRSITKAIARHGLGLYIYAGEDIPFNAESGDKETSDEEANEEVERGGVAIDAKKNIVKNVCSEHNISVESLCKANGCAWDNVSEKMLDDFMRTFKSRGWLE